MNNNHYQSPSMNQNMSGQQAGNQWNDERMLTDLLDTEKHIAGEYGSYVIEGSTQQIRDVLSQNMKETLCDQFKVFEQMQQHGWYKTKPAQQPDVQTAKQTFTQTKGQLL